MQAVPNTIFGEEGVDKIFSCRLSVEGNLSGRKRI
jgi:hypothetical protein